MPIAAALDLLATVRRTGQEFTNDELDAVVRLVRTGTCYRCRIAKGRFFFGATAEEAARRATTAHKKKARKPKPRKE